MQFFNVKKALLCICMYYTAYVSCDGPIYSEVMLTKAAEEVVAAPIQLIWADLYDAIFHKAGSAGWKKLRYLISTGHQKRVTTFVLDKLQEHIFDGKINSSTWGGFAMHFHEALRSWWNRTPEDPLSTLDQGIWVALVTTQREYLGQAMKGSQKISAFQDLLFDPDQEVIKGWAAEYVEGQKM